MKPGYIATSFKLAIFLKLTFSVSNTLAKWYITFGHVYFGIPIGNETLSISDPRKDFVGAKTDSKIIRNSL